MTEAILQRTAEMDAAEAVDIFGAPLDHDEPVATFCPDCGDPVGPVTGICARCHFSGWWWPEVRSASIAGEAERGQE